MYPVVFSENKPSAWLEASRTQGLCVFLCWVKLRFGGEQTLVFPYNFVVLHYN